MNSENLDKSIKFTTAKSMSSLLFALMFAGITVAAFYGLERGLLGSIVFFAGLISAFGHATMAGYAHGVNLMLIKMKKSL